MTITKRTDKGSALTFAEMDENIRDLREDTDLTRVLNNGNETTLDIVTTGSVTADLFYGTLVSANAASEIDINTLYAANGNIDQLLANNISTFTLSVDDSATVENELTANTLNVHTINYVDRNFQPGEIVQKSMVRWATRKTVTGSGDGTAVPELRLTITPKYPNSLLYMQWTIFGEPSNHNAAFVVFKDGVLDSTTGFEGFNNESDVDAGQKRRMAMFQPYETNYDSTPYQMTLNHISSVTALGGISTYYFEPAVAQYTTFLNSSADLTSDGNFENGVSFGYIEEIAQ